MAKQNSELIQRVLPVALGLLLVGFVAQSWFLFQLSREIRDSAPEKPPAPENAQTRAPEESGDPPPSFSIPSPPRSASPAPPLWNHDPWNPFEEMERMREQMDTMFGRMLGGMNRLHEFDPYPRSATHARQPRMNVRETNDAYLLSLEFPGATHAEINTEIRDGHLHVSARVSRETNQNNGAVGRLTHIERVESQFQRSIPLPPDADPDRMTSTYEDGVLRITLPKRQPGIRDTI